MSLEAVQHVLRMFANMQMTPEIETHKFALLRKFRDYELRQYDNYLVAETAMPAGSGTCVCACSHRRIDEPNVAEDACAGLSMATYGRLGIKNCGQVIVAEDRDMFLRTQQV